MKYNTTRPVPVPAVPKFTEMTFTFSREEAIKLAAILGNMSHGGPLSNSVFNAVDEAITEENQNGGGLLNNERYVSWKKELKQRNPQFTF